MTNHQWWDPWSDIEVKELLAKLNRDQIEDIRKKYERELQMFCEDSDADPSIQEDRDLVYDILGIQVSALATTEECK
jgi:hypothetical protein